MKVAATGGLVCAVWLLLTAVPGLADYDDALRAFEAGNDAVALRELRPLAARGSPAARFLLGVMHETGRGGPRDVAAAAGLYRKAADAGNVAAMTALGRLYLKGEGVAQSDARAGDFFRKAAARGSAGALYLLGSMRLEGRGGPVADAPGYLRRAVQAGSPEAAALLGEMLVAGKGIGRDPAAAYRMALAALAGDRVAPATRSRLTTLAETARNALDPTVALRIARQGSAGTAKKESGAQEHAPPEPGRMLTGTGFVVSRVGHVLTNAHVAAQCGRIVTVAGGRRMAARLVRVDRENDLALLRLDVALPRALVFREGDVLPAGTVVHAAGYPGQAAATGQLRVTTGRTRELARDAGPRHAQAVTAVVRPGNSGGPLLDGSGHVAGVVKARRDTTAVLRQTGETPAAMGFVVPLAVVKAFLARGQVPIVVAPSGSERDIGTLMTSLSDTVLPLFCLPAATDTAP